MDHVATGSLGAPASSKRDQLGFYKRTWGKAYGDFVKVRVIAGMDLYILFRPEDIEHVLVRNHKNYRKPGFFNGPVGTLAGKGLVTSEGDLWKTQRKLMQPTFSRERIASLAATMTAAIEELANEWSCGTPGQTIDMQEAMSRLTLKIAGLTLLEPTSRMRPTPSAQRSVQRSRTFATA